MPATSLVVLLQPVATSTNALILAIRPDPTSPNPNPFECACLSPASGFTPAELGSIYGHALHTLTHAMDSILPTFRDVPGAHLAFTRAYLAAASGTTTEENSLVQQLPPDPRS